MVKGMKGARPAGKVYKCSILGHAKVGLGMRHKRTGPIGPRLDRVRERINGADGERKTIERVRPPSNQQPRTTPGLVRGFRDASKTLVE